MILHYYSGHRLDLKSTEIKLPKGQVGIKLSEEIADKLDPIAMAIGKQFCPYSALHIGHGFSGVCQSKHKEMVSYLVYKEESTLGISPKMKKPSPRIVYRYGKQDREIRKFLAHRKLVRNMSTRSCWRVIDNDLWINLADDNARASQSL